MVAVRDTLHDWEKDLVNTRQWMFLWHDGFPAWTVVDCEVDVADPNDYSAFVPGNALVYRGGCNSMGTRIFRFDSGASRASRVMPASTGAASSVPLSDLDKVIPSRLLIGHNLKYDVHWLMRMGLVKQAHVSHYSLVDIPLMWDTQLVEYLLTAQKVKMSSLDDLCRIYGLPIKPSGMKAMWAAGRKTSEIPEAIVVEYLTHDVERTKEIFLKQLEQVRSRDRAFQMLVMSQLNMLRLVTLMEWNGLCLDTKACLDYMDELEKQIVGLEKEIEEYTKALVPELPVEAYDKINYLSNRTTSYVLFGAPAIEYCIVESAGLYKNGNPKTKKVTKAVLRLTHPRGLFSTELPPIPVSKDKVTRSVDEKTLLMARSYSMQGDATIYIDRILKYRELSKLHSTYVSKLPTFIKDSRNSIIHHTLNQSITATGRLSSSKPNMQNRPPEVAKLFRSRADKGWLVSIDFSQIEILALAQECKDPQLLKDLADGKDIHFLTGCEVYHTWRGKDPDKVSAHDRRIVKGVNFGTIYGGSAKAVAEQTGVPKSTVALIQKALYTRYPGIQQWQTRNISLVERNSKVLPATHHPGGVSASYSVLPSVSGRRYMFEDMLSPAWVKAKTGKLTSYSPTQIKNFPIQGLATGDWVPFILADFLSGDKGGAYLLPINTTHDDLELDAIDVSISKVAAVSLIERTFNGYLHSVFPKLWKLWTGTDLLVRLQVKVKSNEVNTDDDKDSKRKGDFTIEEVDNIEGGEEL